MDGKIMVDMDGGMHKRISMHRIVIFAADFNSQYSGDEILSSIVHNKEFILGGSFIDKSCDIGCWEDGHPLNRILSDKQIWFDSTMPIEQWDKKCLENGYKEPCSECGGKTVIIFAPGFNEDQYIDYSSSNVDVTIGFKYKICSRVLEPGHLSDEEINSLLIFKGKEMKSLLRKTMQLFSDRNNF